MASALELSRDLKELERTVEGFTIDKSRTKRRKSDADKSAADKSEGSAKKKEKVGPKDPENTKSEKTSTAATTSEPADIGLADPGPDIHIDNPSDPDSTDDGTPAAPKKKRKLPTVVLTDGAMKDILNTSWGTKKIRSKASSEISSDEDSIPNCPFIDDEAEEVTDDESTGSSVLSSDGSFEKLELEVEST
ncbi:hypothetical protein R1sor_020258 [Riccia sorocarpa]|uniref:Uncharacterized protein n=1 Tax=Riccia sorocarpa TaxID=122646 RepID=A0ABD3IJ46_9MARC